MSKILNAAASAKMEQARSSIRDTAPTIFNTANTKAAPAKATGQERLPSSGSRPGNGITSSIQDNLTLSERALSPSEMEKALFEELKVLQKDFPQVQILIGTGLNAKQLSYTAAGLGEGRHVILSSDWLRQITSSQKAFEEGKQILRRVISGISNNDGEFAALGAYIDTEGVRAWSAKSGSEEPSPLDELQKEYENMKNMLEKMKETTKANKENNPYKVKVSKSSYSTSRVYSRLASASSKGQVQAAMSDARRNIANLRSVATTGTTQEKNKARAAISSLQKVLLRGSRKIRRLNEEDLARARKKRAEKREQELRLRIELEKKKLARKTADRAIALEGHLDDVNNAFRFRKLHKDDEREEGSIYGAYVPAASTAPVAEAAPISAPAGGIAVSDISVSPVMSFGEVMA